MLELQLHHHTNDGSQHIGSAVILPVGNNTGDLGDYQIVVSKRGKPDENWLKAHIAKFPRKKLGPWDLVTILLSAALVDRLNQHIHTSPTDDV